MEEQGEPNLDSGLSRDEIRTIFMEELGELVTEISTFAERYVDVIEADLYHKAWHRLVLDDSCPPATHILTSAAQSFGRPLRYSIGTYDVVAKSGRRKEAGDFGQMLALQENCSSYLSPEDMMQLLTRKDIFGTEFFPSYKWNNSVNLRLWHNRMLVRQTQESGRDILEFDLSNRLVLSGKSNNSLGSRSMVIGDLAVVRGLYGRIKSAAVEMDRAKYEG